MGAEAALRGRSPGPLTGGRCSPNVQGHFWGAASLWGLLVHSVFTEGLPSLESLDTIPTTGRCRQSAVTVCGWDRSKRAPQSQIPDPVAPAHPNT